MAEQGYQNPAVKEGLRIGREYTETIRAFITGDIDKVFDIVAREPFLHNNGAAKSMLARAIKAQLDDAEAYRAIVRLARAAGVPLVGDRLVLVERPIRIEP